MSMSLDFCFPVLNTLERTVNLYCSMRSERYWYNTHSTLSCFFFLYRYDPDKILECELVQEQVE